VSEIGDDTDLPRPTVGRPVKDQLIVAQRLHHLHPFYVTEPLTPGCPGNLPAAPAGDSQLRRSFVADPQQLPMDATRNVLEEETSRSARRRRLRVRVVAGR
jgi:hypothetical protein